MKQYKNSRWHLRMIMMLHFGLITKEQYKISVKGTRWEIKPCDAAGVADGLSSR